MNTITSATKTFLADEGGVTAIEYGLIAALVGIALAGAAEALGADITALFNKIGEELNPTPPASGG